MPWSRVHTEYSIHWVLHHPKIDCLPLPASLSSLGRPCCTQFSTFAKLWGHHWIHSHLPWRLQPELPPPGRPSSSSPPLWHDHGLEEDVHTRSITASKSISELAQLRPPSALHYCLQVYLQTGSITASKFARSWPPSASTHSLDHSLHVHVQTCLNTVYECITRLPWVEPPSVSPNSLDYDLGVLLYVCSITVGWNGGAGRQTAHHQHSAAPCTVSEGNSWARAVLARGP